MTQIFSPPPIDTSQEIFCCYCNNSDHTIIARITNLKNRDCERVVFPKECFFFSVPTEAELEIYQHSVIGVIEDVIPCIELQISQST